MCGEPCCHAASSGRLCFFAILLLSNSSPGASTTGSARPSFCRGSQAYHSASFPLVHSRHLPFSEKSTSQRQRLHCQKQECLLALEKLRGGSSYNNNPDNYGYQSTAPAIRPAHASRRGDQYPEEENDDDPYHQSRRYDNSRRGASCSNYYPDDDRYYDEYYDDDRGRRSPPTSARRSTSSSENPLGAMTSLIKNGNRQIGLPLLAAGAVFTLLGMSLFFNATLMRLGNLLFIAGVPVTLGPSRTVGYFFRPEKSRATACLVAGIFLVMVGWPIFGIAFEIFGLLNLFGNLFPVVMAIAKQMPVIGTILNGNSKNKNGRNGSSRRNGRRYREDEEDGEDRYYYGNRPDDDRYYDEQYKEDGPFY